ncbi:hypothetical protein CDL15_Pgr008351 [Punica granatum]|uniref:Uncharacterized protein n=1 Tax=Punica granatum TaxID=22663 RepID=A0A218XFR8_PUNGR|nr:hypothetical protein CDL15_Pgr008351 [Punica granatum]
MGDRWPVVLGLGPLAREGLGTSTGIFSVCPECLEVLVSGANPRSSVRKGVRGGSGCPDLSRMSPKCARTCHWLFWHWEGFLELHIGLSDE